MLIVMPYGDTPGDATTFASIEAFGRELFGDILPIVEKITGRGQSRQPAIRESRWERASRSRWACGSGQIRLGGRVQRGRLRQAGFDLEKQVPGLLKESRRCNKELKLLYLGCGTEDTRYPAHTRMTSSSRRAASTMEFHDLRRTRMEGLASPSGGLHAQTFWRCAIALLFDSCARSAGHFPGIRPTPGGQLLGEPGESPPLSRSAPGPDRDLSPLRARGHAVLLVGAPVIAVTKGPKA